MPVTPGADETIDYGVAEAVYRQLAGILRNRILSGQYTPGRVLPSENQIEQEFGISRNTTRRAIAILRDEGLVVTVAGRGTYAADADAIAEYRRGQPQG